MPLMPGIEGVQEFEVVEGMLTDVGGTLGFSVLSTPGMISMMERAASMSVVPDLPDGKATVGFEVHVKHVASAPKGSWCSARSRLVEVIDGRKLRFEVEVVSEDHHTVGVGTHERRVIDAGRPRRSI
jgi:predicted thioesterase